MLIFNILYSLRIEVFMVINFFYNFNHSFYPKIMQSTYSNAINCLLDVFLFRYFKLDLYFYIFVINFRIDECRSRRKKSIAIHISILPPVWQKKSFCTRLESNIANINHE
jgi:hypothetical protein